VAEVEDRTVLEPVGPNYVERFYRCGTHLSPFRSVPGGGSAAAGPFQGEDWVGSTTEVVGGSGGLGLSVLADGRRLVDAVRDDPVGFLGAEHLARFGPDTGLLVKLLDAGERLPVHLHPDREFARRHLDCPHGKTEAWVVLEAPADGTVHLGFAEQIAPHVLADWVATQDTDRLLASMNSLPVAAGDTVLVPAGLPHALGAGVFVVELQEPTDWSILLEWAGFAVDGAVDGHLGLGFDVALQAVDRAPLSVERLRALCHRPSTDAVGVHRLLVPAADPFFRAELVRGRGEVEASFAVLVVVEGSMTVTDSHGSRTAVRRGESWVVRYDDGPLSCETTPGGNRPGALVRCLPPPSDSPAGAAAPPRPRW